MPDTPVIARLDDLLAWRPEDKPAIASLMALRRHWSGTLYRRARAEWDAAVGPSPQATLREAAAIAETLPAAREFRQVDRWLQGELWRIAEASVDARLPALSALLVPREADLGTLTADSALTLPDYYSGTDFHLQKGGIWREDRGALVYLMGARLVHVGRNDAFELHDAFAAALPDISPRRVLDLGCGYGKTTFSLRKRWPQPQVIGLDPALPCLRLARRMASERGHAIDWRQGIGERIPEADGALDLVTVTMVFHEIPPPVIRAILTEIRRVLRPGGVLAMLENRTLGDPCRDVLAAWHSMLIAEPWSVPYRALDIAAELAAAGFTAIDHRPWYAAGTSPEIERDTQRWFTPWALSVARR